MKKQFLESLALALTSLVGMTIADLESGCPVLLPMDVILSSLLLFPSQDGWAEQATAGRRRGGWVMAGCLTGEALLRLFLWPWLSRYCLWLHPLYYYCYALWLTTCGYLRSCRRVLFARRHRMFLDFIQQKNRSVLLLLLSVYMLSPQLGMGTELSRMVWVLSLFLTLVLWVWLAVSVRDGRLPVLARGRTREIYQQLRGREVPLLPTVKTDTETIPVSAQVEAEEAERQLYIRCVRYMRDLKPFLDPNFKLLDLCARIGTNKVYLSKTINTHAGRAFPSFVNFFRVQYSIALYKNNRALRVHELSDRSGFNSTVTFNTAFKFETGYTPGEYCALFRDGNRFPTMPEYPSRSRAVER